MRKAVITRETLETDIRLELNVDGVGKSEINTGIGFFDHILTSLAFYAGFDLALNCRGDLHVDSHHTVEDVGLCLGAALKEALGDKVGIRRMATAVIPMDESLALVAVDFSGRPLYCDNLQFQSPRLGSLETQNVQEFLRALCNTAALTLHVDLLRGVNDHHKIEAVFKTLGKALGEATRVVGTNVASTKGVLS